MHNQEPFEDKATREARDTSTREKNKNKHENFLFIFYLQDLS